MARQQSSKDVSDLGILLTPLDSKGALGGSDFFDQLDQLWREAKAPPLRGTDRHHPPQGFIVDSRGNVIPAIAPEIVSDSIPATKENPVTIAAPPSKYTGRAIASLLNKLLLPKEEEKAKALEGRPLSALTEGMGASLAASARLGSNSISMSVANFTKENSQLAASTPQGGKKGGKKGKPNPAEEERLRQLESEQKEKEEREKREKEEAEAAELIRNRPRDLWVENAMAHQEEAEAFARALQPSFEWAQKRADYFKQRPSNQYLIEDVLGENIPDHTDIPHPSPFSVDAIAYSKSRITMLEETLGFKAPRGLHVVGKSDPKLRLEELSAEQRTNDDALLLSMIQQHSGCGDVASKPFVCAPTIQQNIQTTRSNAHAALEEEAKAIAEAEHLEKINTKSSTAAKGLAHSPHPPKNGTANSSRGGAANDADASLNNVSINFGGTTGKANLGATSPGNDDPSSMIELSTSLLVFPHSHPFHTYTQKVIVWNRDKCKRRLRLHQSPNQLIAITPLSCGIAGSKSRRGYDPNVALVSGETLEFEVSYTPTTAAPAEFTIKIGHAREINSAKGMDPNTVWCDTCISVMCSGAKPELELVTHPHSSLPVCPIESQSLDLSVEPNPSFVKSTKLRAFLQGRSHSMLGLSAAIAEIRHDCTASVGRQVAQNIGPSVVDVSATSASSASKALMGGTAASNIEKAATNKGNLGTTTGKKSAAAMTMALVKEQAEVDSMAQDTLLSIAANNYMSFDPCFLFSRVIKRVKFYNAGSSGRFVIEVKTTENIVDNNGKQQTQQRKPFRVIPSELTVKSGEYADVDIYFEPRQAALYTAGFVENPSQMFYDHDGDLDSLPPISHAALTVTAWLDHGGNVDQTTNSTFTVGIEAIAIAPLVSIDNLAGTSVASVKKDVLTSAAPFGNNKDLLASVPVVHFKDACVGHTSHRTVTVTNTGPIPIDFVWDTQVRKNAKTTNDNQEESGQQADDAPNEHKGILSISPVSGTLKANSTTSFTVSLVANDVSTVEGLLKLLLLGLPDPSLCVAREEGILVNDADVGEDDIGDTPQHRLMTRAIGHGPVEVFSRAIPIPLLSTVSATNTDPFTAFRQLYSSKQKQIKATAAATQFTATGGGAIRGASTDSSNVASVDITTQKLSQVANSTLTSSGVTEETIVAARSHFNNSLIPNIDSLCDERQQQHAITIKERRQSSVFRPSILKGSISVPNEGNLLHFYPTAFVVPDSHKSDISSQQVEVDELIETLLVSRSPLFSTAIRCLADPMTSAVSVTPAQIVDKLACLVGCENLREFQITNHSNRAQRFWIDPPQGAAHPRVNKNYQAAQAKKERKAQKESNNPILSSLREGGKDDSSATSSKFSHEIRGNCSIKLTPDMGVIPPNSTITVSAVLTLTKPGSHFVDIEVYLPDLEAAALVALGGQPAVDATNLLSDDAIDQSTIAPAAIPPNLSQRLSIVTNAVGPAVSVNTKLLDLGVIPLNEEGEGRITVSNNNPVPVVLRVYDPESQHRKSTDETNDVASATSTTIERYACLPTTAKLRPGATIDVTIFRRGLKPEHIQEFIHLAVEGGQVTPVEVHALVQKPSASINPSIVNFGTVHRDVPTEKEILLSNQSPIDLQYSLHVVGSGSLSSPLGNNNVRGPPKGRGAANRPSTGTPPQTAPFILLPPPGVLRAGQSDLPLRIVATFFGTSSGPQTALVVLTSPQLDTPIPVELHCDEVSQLVVSLDVLVPPRTGPKSAAEVSAAAHQKNISAPASPSPNTLGLLRSGALTPFLITTANHHEDPNGGLIRLAQTAKDFIRDVVLNLVEMCFDEMSEKPTPPSPISSVLINNSPTKNTEDRRPSSHSSRSTTMLTPRSAVLAQQGAISAKLRPYCPNITVPFASMTDDRPFVSTSAIVRLTNQSGCGTKYAIAPLLFHLEGARNGKASNSNMTGESLVNISTLSTASATKPSSAPAAAGGGLKAIRSTNNKLNTTTASLSSTKLTSNKQQQQAFEVPPIKPLETNSQVKLLDGREDVEAHENAKLIDATDLLVDGKGCSVLITNGDGPLRPFATQDVQVTFMSNIPGLYKDKLRVNMDGMPPVDLDLELSVSGKVVILDPATSGLAISGDALAVAQAQATASASSATAARSTLPRLMLPTVVAGAKKVTRRLRLTSRCPRDIEVYARFVNAEQFYTLQVVERELLGTPTGNGVTTDMMWSEAGEQPDFESSKKSVDTRSGYATGARGLEVVLETPQLGTKDFFALAAGLDIVGNAVATATSCDKAANEAQGMSPRTLNEHSVCSPSRFLMKAMESAEVIIEYHPPTGSTNDWKAVLVVASRIATTTYNDKFIVDEYYRRYAVTKGFVPYSRNLAAESLVTNEAKSKSMNVRGVAKVGSRVPHINRARVIKDSVIINAVADEMTRAENLIRSSMRKDQKESSKLKSIQQSRSANQNDEDSEDDAEPNSSEDEASAIVSAGGNLSVAAKMDLEVQRRQKEAKARAIADEEERETVRNYVKNRRSEIQRESEEYFSPIEVLVVAKNVQPKLTADPAGEVTFPLCTPSSIVSIASASASATDNALSVEKRNHRTIRLTNNNTTPLTFECEFTAPNPLEPRETVVTQVSSSTSKRGVFYVKDAKYIPYDGQTTLGAEGEKLQLKTQSMIGKPTTSSRLDFVSSAFDGSLLYTIHPNDTIDITIGLSTECAEIFVGNRSALLLSSKDNSDAATMLHRLTSGEMPEAERAGLTGSQYQKLLLAAARQQIDGLFKITFIEKKESKNTKPNSPVTYFQTFPLTATLNVPYLTPTPNQTLFRPMGIVRDGHPQTHFTRHIKLVNYSIVDAEFQIEHDSSKSAAKEAEDSNNVEKVRSLQTESQLQPLQSTVSPPQKLAKSSNETSLSPINPNPATTEASISLPPINRVSALTSAVSVLFAPEHKVKHIFANITTVDDPSRFTIYPLSGRVPAATIGGAPGELTIDVDFNESAKTFYESTFRVVTKSKSGASESFVPPSTFVLRGESSQCELL